MGSSGGQQQTQQSGPKVPAYELPLLKKQAGADVNAMNQTPTLGQLYQSFPQLNVPGLTGGESNIVEMMTQIGENQGLTAQGKQAQDLISGLTSGPIGSSPDTLAAEKAFTDLAAPQVMQNAVLQGQGTSGAATEAMAQAQEQAMVPFIQQEVSNRLNAIPPLLQGQENQVQNMQAALEAAGLPRAVAQQQAQAEFEKKMGQSQLAQSAQTSARPLLGAAIGGGTQVTTSSAPKLF